MAEIDSPCSLSLRLTVIVNVFLPVTMLMTSQLHVSYGMLLTNISLTNGSRCYYEYPESAGMCYVIGSRQGRTWPDAYHSCAQYGGQLLMKPTATRTAVVHEIMKRHNVTEAWLGMTKVLVPWTWTSDRSKKRPPPDLWADNEPKSAESEQDCVVLSVEGNYKMVTYPCYQRAGFVCQADVNSLLCQNAAVYVTEIIYHNGSCYIFVDGSRDRSMNITWFEVANACAELSYDFDGRSVARSSLARPAVINSHDLYTKINQASPGMSHDISQYWIGLSRARWISSAGLMIDHFFAEGEIRCVTMVTRGNIVPVYKSYPCEQSFNYICQFDLLKFGNIPIAEPTPSNDVTETRTVLNMTSTTARDSGGRENKTVTKTTTTTTTSKTPPPPTTTTFSPDAQVNTAVSAVVSTSTTTTTATTTTTISTTSTAPPGVQTNNTPNKAINSASMAPIDGTTAPLAGNLVQTTKRDASDVRTDTDSDMTSTPISYATSKQEMDIPPRSSQGARPVTSQPLISVTSSRRCENSFPLSLTVYVTAQLRDVSDSRTVNVMLNDVIERVTPTSSDVCLSVSLITFRQSLTDFSWAESAQGSADGGSGYRIDVVFAYCNYDNLRTFEGIGKTRRSYRMLVCLSDTPEDVEARRILDRFDSVVPADDVTAFDDATGQVTNWLLNHLSPPATPSVGTETTNWLSEGANANSATNTKSVILVAAIPSVVIVLLILVVVLILVVRKKAAVQRPGAAPYHGLGDSYEKILRNSAISQCSEQDNNSGGFYFENDTTTQVNPVRSEVTDPASTHISDATVAPSTGNRADIEAGSREARPNKPTVNVKKKTVHFAWDTITRTKQNKSYGRRSGQTLALERNYNHGAGIKRSKKGVVKLNAPKGGATIYTENTPNTLFYNCWTVPSSGKY